MIKLFLHVCAVLLPIMLSGYHASAASQRIVVCFDDNYPPYSYVENGRLTGIYPEILASVFSRISGFTIVMEPVQWSRGIKLLKSGQIFALVPPYYRKDDRPYMDYSDPILEERLVCVCRSDTLAKGRPVFPDDYLDLRIGINSGFASIKPGVWGKMMIIESNGSRVNILNLLRGRIDGYVNDELSIFWELDQLRRSGEYREGKDPGLAAGAVLGRERGHIGFTRTALGKYPFKDEFVRKFNAALSEAKSRGEIQSVRSRYAGSR
jgi:polar amino acid transport system substrate-binding protein